MGLLQHQTAPGAVGRPHGLFSRDLRGVLAVQLGQQLNLDANVALEDGTT